MVKPDKILKELAKLWVDLGHEEQQDTEQGSGVLRACAMTLITVVDESEDPTDVGETVAQLMKEHPSRSIVIRLRNTSEALLDSRVFAQCWMPFGQRRQICCEQIEITASDPSLDDVPAVVLPLTVPDLPVILWARSARLIGMPAFPQIAAMADKVIVDSAEFSDTGRAFGLIATQMEHDRLIADLAWVRVTRWRELLSQVFGNRECLDAIGRFTSARVEFGGERARPDALYLAGWLENGLRAAGNQTAVEMRRAGGDAVVGIALSGAGTCDISIHCDKAGGVEVVADGLSTRAVFPAPSDYLALQEELSIVRRDAMFEAALPRARRMLQEGAKG